MEFEEELNCVPGYVPEFGAIFMSNATTKKECFRRKLLGLPSSQANFVKQVKSGMILFLFEFERRELHGVFQASSDGAMNIVPNAYSSTGKQFPAQVKFTPLWNCGPLSEDEFSDAIQENYFAAKKFNFGLSEDQVCKLLYLFSLRKLKPQRQCSRNRVARISRAANEANDFGAAISTVYPDFVQADSSVKPSSTFRHSMEPQVSNLSCPTSSGDLVPYDPDVPGIDAGHSLSQDFAPPRCSGFGCCVPLSSSNQCENSRRARMPLLEAAYSENMVPVCFSDSGYIDSIDERRTHFLSPSYIPSFVLDYGYYEASQEKHDHEMQHCGINEACAANIPVLKENQSQLQDHLCSVRSENADYDVNSSLKPDVYKDAGSLHPDNGKKRESVFSRLRLASKAWIKENDTLVGDDEGTSDTSVNEVMSMLYQSRHQWLKMRKSRQLIKDNATNSGTKRQRTISSQSLKDHFQKICKEVKMNDIPASEESGDLFVEETSFVDFRRRSEVRRTHNSHTRTGSCNGTAESEGSLGGLCKRRKLIRPDFSKNELPGESTNIDTYQNVVLQDVLSQISHTDKNIIETEVVSDDRGEVIGETFGAPSRYIDEDRKELSQIVGSRSMPSSVSCEDGSNIAEQGLIMKDSIVDGLSRDIESSHGTCKRDATEITSGEMECCIGNEEMYLNPDFDSEISIDTVKDSSNQNPKSEKALNELVASGPVDAKSSHTDKNIIETEVVSDDRGEVIGETFGAPSRYIDGSRSMPSSVSCEDGSNIAEQGLIMKDSILDGLPQDLSNIESSRGTCKSDATGITSGEMECRRGNEEEMYPNPDFDSEISIDTLKDSSNQNPKSEKALNELVANGPVDAKATNKDFQQNVESEK